MILLGAFCFVLASFPTHSVTREDQFPSVSYSFVKFKPTLKSSFMLKWLPNCSSTADTAWSSSPQELPQFFAITFVNQAPPSSNHTNQLDECKFDHDLILQQSGIQSQPYSLTPLSAFSPQLLCHLWFTMLLFLLYCPHPKIVPATSILKTTQPKMYIFAP